MFLTADPSAPQPFVAPHHPATPVPPTPFRLTSLRDDVALFQDARAAFSHLVPGRPILGANRPDDPADATLHLQDAPITLRYRLEPPALAAATADELARKTAERYGTHRARAEVSVTPANATWLAAWGVEAAAVSAYDTADAREDLFVLVRQGLVLIVTWTYPRGFVDDPAYATFASIAEATMAWDPSRFEQRGRVWPESEIMGPGLSGGPKAKHHEGVKLLAMTPLADEERARLLVILAGIVSSAGAPWVPLSPESLASARNAIGGATREPAMHAFLDRAFGDVHTVHDLRSLAVLLGRALDGRRRSGVFA